MFQHLKSAVVPFITLTLMLGIALVLRLGLVLEHMR